MVQRIEIGRVLRAGTTEFVVGCRVGQLEVPAFGALVRAPVGADDQVYALIHDIHIEDDGLVRQLVTAEGVSAEVVQDNRERRIVPVEMSVIVVGHERAGVISHRLPPRPPLSLDVIYLGDAEDLVRFTSAGHFGYFRHILRNPDLPVGELLAAHIEQARAAHEDSAKWSDAAAHEDSAKWSDAAVQELITLLRDDYPLLTAVLSALDSVIGTDGAGKADI